MIHTAFTVVLALTTLALGVAHLYQRRTINIQRGHIRDLNTSLTRWKRRQVA